MSSVPASDVLSVRQLAFIAERLPEPTPAPRGRRPYSNQELLPGILRVLRSGCRSRVRPSAMASRPLGVHAGGHPLARPDVPMVYLPGKGLAALQVQIPRPGEGLGDGPAIPNPVGLTA